MRERSYKTKNYKPLTQIDRPIHLYFETELEALHKHFTKTGDTVSLALIEPELDRRRQETLKVQQMTPKVRLSEYQQKYQERIKKAA